MNYYKINLTIIPNTEIYRDVLSASLAGIGFESFVETDKGTDAFVPEKIYSEKAVAEALENFPLPDVQIQYGVELIESKDWNEAWEKHSFQPIMIDSQVVIHGSFHPDIPVLPYDIVIDPKMAFGTGHHATTSLMVSYVLEMNLQNRSFLDMGCGTAVLAILASKKGANPITAIDNDQWAYENSLENVRLNNIPSIRVVHGDASCLGKESYDIIFANINRNILLNDIPAYASCMHRGSSLVVSGFYRKDLKVITETGQEHGLHFVSFKEKSDWTAAHFKKLS
jgi:ribosomal protein L11 methyltransferase